MILLMISRNCTPRLSAAAAEKLSNHFVEIRGQVRQMERDMSERSSIPITVRQLEAVVRIAESLAKMSLQSVANESHVDEALRLFRVSTMSAAQSGQGAQRAENLQQVRNVEKVIRRRLPIGSQISVRTLYNELHNQVKETINTQGHSKYAVDKAVQVLLKQETLQYRNQRILIYRAGV